LTPSIGRNGSRWLCYCLLIVLVGCVVPHSMSSLDPADPCPVDQTVTWVGPDQAHDRRQLNDWCSTVGPAVLLRAAAGHRVIDQGDSIAVVSWNVRGRAGELSRLLQEQFGISCSGPATTSEVPVVILVQEALRIGPEVPDLPPGAQPVPLSIAEPEGLEGAADIVAAAESCGLSLAYLPSMRNGAKKERGEGEDKGNAILATVPLTDVVGIELPWETQRRVAVAATLRTSTGDSLRLASAHLDVSPGLWRVLKTGNSSRLRQGLGLVEGLAVVECARGRPPGGDAECRVAEEDTAGYIATVVGADLNTWSGHQTVIRHLRHHFPQSPAWDGIATRGRFPADHVFFRTPEARPDSWVAQGYLALDDSYRSDHLPRVLWLRFQGN